ncbi:MAG: hypothetical protein AAF573_05965, partial [Bacteroidota bacterium]
LTTQQKVWTDNTGTIVLKEMQAHDIDTLEDWEVAEFKYSLNLSSQDQAMEFSLPTSHSDLSKN